MAQQKCTARKEANEGFTSVPHRFSLKWEGMPSLPTPQVGIKSPSQIGQLGTDPPQGS